MRGRRGQLERSGSSTGFDVYTPDLYSVVEGSGRCHERVHHRSMGAGGADPSTAGRCLGQRLEEADSE